jgi:NAD(P)-dependent dehydrogenase (short-subunit alcohol dehydrogenase family)
MVMEQDLAGKVAVVTGASKGIGLAIVRALADAGAHVVAGARKSSSDLDELATSGRVEVALADLSQAGAAATLIEQAGDRVDILVNNVGAAPARTDGFLAITDADWHSTLEINLMAAVRCTRAALPGMIAAGRGVIVNNCSVNARLPDPGVMDYSAAKAALASFSKALSKEVGARGIRVNTVSAGPVATDLWLGQGGVAATVGAATGADPQDVRNQAAKQMVTGRFTRPEEVADLVLYLAGDRAANITGSDFVIDGGLIQTL